MLHMTPVKWMKTGAIACGIMAIAAVIVSDMHATQDLVIVLAQAKGSVFLLPEGSAFPYWLAGLVGEPILITAIYIFGLGFIGAWKKTGEKTAKKAGVLAFIYGTARIFSAIAAALYAMAVESVQVTGDLTKLVFPGMLKGVSVLIAGIIGGIIFASFIALYFSRTGVKLGKIGGMIVVIAVAMGIPVKTLATWILPYVLTGAFLLLMAVKSVGLVFVIIALYQQAA